jgi:MFS-type transporter involved in bile tolerance (Atg22 family)
MLSLGQRLFPKAKFAQFYSAMLLVQSSGLMVMPSLMGRFLDLTGRQYEYIFIVGGLFCLLGLAALVVVYRKFLAHGGLTNYRAPK